MRNLNRHFNRKAQGRQKTEKLLLLAVVSDPALSAGTKNRLPAQAQNPGSLRVGVRGAYHLLMDPIGAIKVF